MLTNCFNIRRGNESDVAHWHQLAGGGVSAVRRGTGVARQALIDQAVQGKGVEDRAAVAAGPECWDGAHGRGGDRGIAHALRGHRYRSSPRVSRQTHDKRLPASTSMIEVFTPLEIERKKNCLRVSYVRLHG